MKINSKKRYINAKLYDQIKNKIRKEFCGKKNPFYGKGHYGKDNHFFGKKHTKQSKERMSNALKGRKPTFLGKRHSKKTREKLRKIHSIPIVVFFTDGSKKEFSNRLELGLFLQKSKELGAALLRKEKHHLWSKYNISNIEIKK